MRATIWKSQHRKEYPTPEETPRIDSSIPSLIHESPEQCTQAQSSDERVDHPAAPLECLSTPADC